MEPTLNVEDTPVKPTTSAGDKEPTAEVAAIPVKSTKLIGPTSNDPILVVAATPVISAGPNSNPNVPTLNVDDQMLEEESVDNKAEEPSEEAAESTNLPVFLSTETAEEQEEIFSNQSMPVPEKAKTQVVVIQSFKKYLSGVSSTDDGVYASDITTNNKDAENKTQPKVRP